MSVEMPRRQGMFTRIIGIAVASIVILTVVYAAGAYFGYFPNPLLRFFLDPSEHSARYYPQDTEIYVWLTLYPGGSQQTAVEDMWERLNQYRAFRQRYEESQEDIEELIGINLEDDLQSWIGPEISAGFLEQRDDGDIAAATLGVRDKNAALLFLDQWLDFLEDTEGANFEADSFLDFDIWVDETAGQAYALSEDLLLVVLSDEDPGDVLEEMIGLATDDSKPSLADDANFQAARELLASPRFASIYFGDLESWETEAEDFAWEPDYSNWLDILLAVLLYSGGETPAWVAASAKWVDRGIVLEVIGPDQGDPLANLDNPAELLPNTTLGFFAIEEDYDVDEWRDDLAELSDTDSEEFQEVVSDIYWPLYYFAEIRMSTSVEREAEPDLVDVLDLSLDLAEEEIGIDLESEFFDYLGSQTILAIDEFDFRKVEKDPEENPIDAVLMLEYDSAREADLEDTMDQAADALEDFTGVDIDPVNVGADKHAKLFDAAGYTPGYILHDGYLTVGTTRKSLETIVALQKGEGATLDKVAEYRRALDHLPRQNAVLAWFNLHYVVSELDLINEAGLTRRDHRLLRETLGNLAAGISSDGTHFRGHMTLTFFPE